MKKALLLIFIALLGGSCQKSLWVDKEPNIDTKVFQTYSWNTFEANKSESYHNQLEIDELVIKEVEAALLKSGFKKVNDETADFFVDYNIYVKDNFFEETVCPTGFYGNMGYAPDLNPWPRCDVEERTIVYDSGTLVIDVIDTRTGQIVWRGSARSIIDNPLYAPEIFSKRVKKLMRRFNSPS